MALFFCDPWTEVCATIVLAFCPTTLFCISHLRGSYRPLLRTPVLPSTPGAMPYLYGSPYYSSYAYPYSYGAYSYPYSSAYSYPYSYGYGYGYPYSRYYW